MKAGENKKNDITNTSGLLVQVWTGPGGSLKKIYIQIMHHTYTLGKKVCYSAKNPKADGKMSSRFGA